MSWAEKDLGNWIFKVWFERTTAIEFPGLWFCRKRWWEIEFPKCDSKEPELRFPELWRASKSWMGIYVCEIRKRLKSGCVRYIVIQKKLFRFFGTEEEEHIIICSHGISVVIGGSAPWRRDTWRHVKKFAVCFFAGEETRVAFTISWNTEWSRKTGSARLVFLVARVM